MVHSRAALKILAYVQSTQDVGLLYRRNAPVHLVGVTDASFASDPDERRSQGGYLYLLGRLPLFIRGSCRELEKLQDLNRGTIHA